MFSATSLRYNFMYTGHNRITNPRDLELAFCCKNLIHFELARALNVTWLRVSRTREADFAGLSIINPRDQRIPTKYSYHQRRVGESSEIPVFV